MLGTSRTFRPAAHAKNRRGIKRHSLRMPGDNYLDTHRGLEVLTRAFTGERFSFTGKRYQFQDVKITPGYVQAGGPPLWVAALAEAGAMRAARFNTNLLPQGPRGQTLDPWRKALHKSGRDPAKYRVGIIKSCLVTNDRARDWPAVRAGEQRRMAVYNQFRAESGGHGGVAGITEEARIPQTWIIGTVDECVDQMAAFIREYGLTDVVTWAVPPGMRPDQMNDSLEKLARDVAPRLRAMFPG